MASRSHAPCRSACRSNCSAWAPLACEGSTFLCSSLRSAAAPPQPTPLSEISLSSRSEIEWETELVSRAACSSRLAAMDAAKLSAAPAAHLDHSRQSRASSCRSSCRTPPASTPASPVGTSPPPSPTWSPTWSGASRAVPPASPEAEASAAHRARAASSELLSSAGRLPISE